MSNTVKRTIQIILIITILFSGYKIASYIIEGYKSVAKTEEINDMVEAIENDTSEVSARDLKVISTDNERAHADSESPVEASEKSSKIEIINNKVLSKLKERNSDIQAFIKSKPLGLSYPVTWKQGDNEYYLHRDIDKDWVFSGTIYIDKDNKTDFSDYNTVLYGHNMKRTAPEPMFRGVLQLNKRDFVNSYKNIDIEIYTSNGPKTYRIFSAYLTDIKDDYYEINRGDDWVQYLNNIRRKSTHNFNYTGDFNKEDRIITLSTCDNDMSNDAGRFVAHAVLLK